MGSAGQLYVSLGRDLCRSVHQLLTGVLYRWHGAGQQVRVQVEHLVHLLQPLLLQIFVVLEEEEERGSRERGRGGEGEQGKVKRRRGGAGKGEEEERGSRER